MEAQDVYYTVVLAVLNSVARGCGKGGARGRGRFGRSGKVVNWRSGQRDSNSQSSQRMSRKTNFLDANGEISCCHT